MDRPNKFELSPQTGFLCDPAGQELFELLESSGHQIFFVGGCVRNAVMGLGQSDIDVSTSAEPQEVIKLAKLKGMRVIPTGIDYGTVTLIVQGKSFEITTFRKDVSTDGRRAVVEFSADIAEDAARRDFTMNALYVDRHGVLHDPLGGLSDALERRVRFIQDPDQRIREDYLRILRFFRFSAYYADDIDCNGRDLESLTAIASNLDGLEKLSMERVGAETLNLLSAPDPVQSLTVMETVGVLQRILPGAKADFLGPFVHLETMMGAQPDPIARLAVLGGFELDKHLRLSRSQNKKLKEISEYSASTLGPKAIGYLCGPEKGLSTLILRAVMSDQSLSIDANYLIEEGSHATFPILASDLPSLSGPSLGQRLKLLKSTWLATELKKSKEELLKQ